MTPLSFTSLITALLLLWGKGHAQTDVYQMRQENEHDRIALSDILGTWYWTHTDSTRHALSFVNESNAFVHIPEIKHGVGSYLFTIAQDSVHVNGTAANWPPYYCTLHLRDKNTLELTFYMSIYPGSTTTVCRRD